MRIILRGFLLGFACFLSLTPQVSTHPSTPLALKKNRFQSLPLPSSTPRFVANRGQWGDRSFDYLARLNSNNEVAVDQTGWRIATQRLSNLAQADVEKSSAVMLRYTLLNSERPQLIAGAPAPGLHNYFLGNDKERWQTGVPLYDSLEYVTEAQEHFQLQLSHNALTYVLEARPGANVRKVRVRVDGTQGMHVAPDGSLVLATEAGEIRQTPPTAGYRYEIENLNTFRVVPTNDKQLVIANAKQLKFSTLLGGNDIDEIHAMAEPRDGVMTVCGITAEALFGLPNFPVTPGAFQPVHKPKTQASGLNNWPVTHESGGAMDGFVTQMRVTRVVDASAGNFSGYMASKNNGNWKAELVYSTFLGSNANDYLEAIHLSNTGLITVGGYIEHNTVSGLINDYPLTPNAVQDTMHYIPGNQGMKLAFREAIITQIDPKKTGQDQLVYSTYFGGRYHDDIRVVHGQGPAKIIFGGFTSSDDLPGINGYSYDALLGKDGQPHNYSGLSFEYDAFVASIGTNASVLSYQKNPLGVPNPYPHTAITWATYLGGSNPSAYPWDGTFEMINDLNVSGSTVTVIGRTDALDFPVSNPTIQPTIGSSWPLQWDAFVTQLQINGNKMQLGFSTYLGGGDFDLAEKLYIDPTTKFIYLVGNTSSGAISHYDATCNCYTPSNTPFPTTPGAYDTNLNNENNQGYISGCTQTSAPFLDSFVTIIDPKLTSPPHIVASTFFGGSDDEIVTSIAVNKLRQVVITGWSHSSDLQTTANAYMSGFNYGNPVLFDICNQQSMQNAADIFIARFDANLTSLLHGSYFGAQQDDFARKVTVTDSGEAWIAGHTYSNEVGNIAYSQYSAPLYVSAPFPTTKDAFSRDYTYATGAWGVHVNDYSGNIWFNLGEPQLAVIKIPVLGTERYGAASSSCSVKPVIDATAIPKKVGGNFAVAVVNAPKNATGFLWLSTNGADQASWNNVKRLVKAPYQTLGVTTDSSGVGQRPVLLQGYAPGTKLWAQFVFVDPSCSGPNGQYVASDATEITVQ